MTITESADLNLTVNLPKYLLQHFKNNTQQNVQSYCKTASGTPVRITTNVVYVVTSSRIAVGPIGGQTNYIMVSNSITEKGW